MAIWGTAVYGLFVQYRICRDIAVVVPLFNREKEEEEGVNKLFDVLLNYVLSPALLIYAVILYLYFVKVAVLWSLPKGAVAYIVVSFISATFILKSCQPFLERRYYDWFYRYSGWAVLPALVMYWVGTFYRINQYGYTEARVYLVVVGAILTGTVLLFFFRRTAHYLYAVVLAVVLLSFVTYIPCITARDIERISQEKRDNYPIPANPGNYYEYVTITDYSPLDITGYETLQAVGCYDEGPINSMIQMDTFYLCDKNSLILLKQKEILCFSARWRRLGWLRPIRSRMIYIRIFSGWIWIRLCMCSARFLSTAVRRIRLIRSLIWEEGII